ncbi:ORF027L [Infectious spleen and kidney necrosis virus]|uniref:ORF027L n=1 Tax=Infectious spleen and kidney necrosis virus TaxID=180170 RepID=A0A140G0K1_ISKNV|nr:ORF027L [Infectious spleen and kidney necrosis virus]
MQDPMTIPINRPPFFIPPMSPRCTSSSSPVLCFTTGTSFWMAGGLCEAAAGGGALSGVCCGCEGAAGGGALSGVCTTATIGTSCCGVSEGGALSGMCCGASGCEGAAGGGALSGAATIGTLCCGASVSVPAGALSC